MTISKLLFREKTPGLPRQIITFNAPGTYHPPYGKSQYLLQGQGEPGTPNAGGTYAGTNPATPGGISGYNPPVPGTYLAGGNANYNPTMLHGSWGLFNQSNLPPYPTQYFTGVWGPSATQPASGVTYPANMSAYAVYYLTPPPVPGNVANYNTTYYNPASPGNATYNPSVPGNAYYNPSTPGSVGAPASILGVALPGGGIGSAAPIVGYVPININYTDAGIPISVPPGGYVKIQNT